MNYLYFYTLLVSAIAMLFLGIHIYFDKSLTPNSKKWFTISALIPLCDIVIECICTDEKVLKASPAFFGVLIIVEIISQPYVSSTQSFACGMKKMGKVAFWGCTLMAVPILVLYFTGKLFTISETGAFISSDLLGAAVTVVSLIHATFTLNMLYMMSRKYNEEKSPSLFLIGLLLLIACTISIISGYAAVGFVTSAFAFYLLYTYYTSLCSKLMTEKIIENEKRLEELSYQSMQSLSNAIDAKDKYTNGHSHRVAEYSVILARELGWDEERLQFLRYAGLMHDIGKIGIPDSVLNKPGRLSDTEFGMIKSHPVFGSEIASKVTTVPEAYNAARSHHERYDGKGYPDKKSGEDIPEIARIIAVADAFDAMNSDRIYRKALPKKVIIDELKKGSGSQFDPYYAEVFIKLFEDGKLYELSASGRDDLKASFKTGNSLIAGKISAFFGKEYEENGGYSERFDDFARLIKSIGDDEESPVSDFHIVEISVIPQEGRNVDEEQKSKALSVMAKCADAYLAETDISLIISNTQVIAAFRRETTPDIPEKMQQIFLYFYKIFDAVLFSIDYRIISE